MDTLTILIILVVGAAAGGGICWLVVRSMYSNKITLLEANLESAKSAAEEKISMLTSAHQREAEELKSSLTVKEEELANLRNQIQESRSKLSESETRLEEERKAAAEKLALIEDAQKHLSDAFKNLANEALESSSKSFLRLASEAFDKHHTVSKGDLEQRKQAIEGLVKPLQEALKNYDEGVRKVRETEGTLLEQLKDLRGETETLSRALRQPQVRGRWGEMQLERLVEMAGMSEYCDFDTQTSVSSSDKRLRPDLIVRLPGNKIIVVDAKTPLQAYLDAMETDDSVRRNKFLKDHAKNVRQQVLNLSAKQYWDQFPFTPDFAVMFIPGEHFLGAALKEYPGLFEEAVQNKVLLATPVNFIALLKTIALLWRQKKMMESAEIVSKMGAKLYDNLNTLAGHLAKLHTNLDRTVGSFNDLVRSMESRVLVSARKFKELGVTSKGDIPVIEAVEKTPRKPSEE